MKTSLVLLLLSIWLILSLATRGHSTETGFRCGETTVYSMANRRVRRVVGGGPAMKGAWPWQAIVANRRSNVVETLNTGLSGGGTLINSKWILTAANVVSGLIQRHTLANVTENVIIALGYSNLPDIDAFQNRDGRLFKPQEMIMHPNYDRELRFDYDVALIRIGREVVLDGDLLVDLDENSGGSVEFHQYIRPICLPCTGTCVQPEDLVGEDGTKLLTGEETPEEACSIEGKWLSGRSRPGNNVEGIVTGFGVTTKSLNITLPKTLQQGLLRIQNDTECRNFITSQGGLSERGYTPRMLCARSGSDDVDTDSCSGDSGNGLVREILNSNGRLCWVEVGIVSFGYGCATRVGDYTYPGFYTDVSSVSAWIQEIIQH